MFDLTDSQHSEDDNKPIPAKSPKSPNSKYKYAKVAQQSTDLNAIKQSIELNSTDNIELADMNNIEELSPTAAPLDNQYTKGVCLKLLTDYLVWVRICLLIFIVLLSVLTAFYCISQPIDTRLDIITECSKPKTKEEIWQHSNEIYLKNGKMDNESCWTTRKIEINTDHLWHNAKYISESNNTINPYYIAFAVIFIYLAMIILHNILTFITDIIRIKNNKMHIKYKQNQENKNCCQQLYTKYLKNDTIGWLVIKLLGENIQLILQSMTLLLLNGYNVFDSTNEYDIYLANKPHIIKIFAYILCFHYVGTGVLWLLYALFSCCCFGVLFNRLIFFVDFLSDLCYALFPLYLYLTNEYNQFAQINSHLMFASIFVPLLFLCNRFIFICTEVRHKMYRKYFQVWLQFRQVSISSAFKHYQSHGYSFNKLDISPEKTETDHINQNRKKNCVYYNTENENAASFMKIFNQILIAFVSIFFITFGVILLLYTLNYLKTSQEYCESVIETKLFNSNTFSITNTEVNILSENPELYLWEKCLYKTYPFVDNKQSPCQCRTLVINWENLLLTETERRKHFNLSQEIILNGVLNHWYMLEFFHTFGDIGTPKTVFIITPSMYKSGHMKAFDFRDIYISFIFDGISSWNKLEYLAFVSTSFMKELPSDFDGLQSLQYLLLKENGLKTISNNICKLSQLKVLQVEFETDIKSLPHCIADLTELKAIWFDVTGLKQIPLSIFDLPNLVELSLVVGDINFENLLHYNNISIQVNDSLAMDKWFNDNFNFHEDTDYWLMSNPICQEIELLPVKLQYLVNETCEELCPFSPDNFCPPRAFGDGKCTEGCQTMECYWDNGDCNQLCLTSCSLDELIECDDVCNDDFCLQSMDHCIGNDSLILNEVS